MAEENLNNVQTKSISALAVTSLVIGIIALLTSFIPIVNNASAFLGVLGIIFGIVGLIGIFKGKKKSKPLGVIAMLINIIAIVIVIATQNMYGQALNNASEKLNDAAGNPAKSIEGESSVKVGEPIKFNNGLEIVVLSLETGFKNYDGSELVKANVKYVNNGSKEVSYNTYDWKAENSQGNQTSNTIYTGQGGTSDALSSGNLAAGGTVTGSMYFKADVAKMVYSPTFMKDVSATWVANK